MMSPLYSRNTFARHVAELRLRIGDLALEVRHEWFFLAARHRQWAGWCGCLALLRDAWLLSRGPAAGECGAQGDVILLATLAGGSGWGTLARCLAHIPTGSVHILAHPRLAVQSFPEGVPVARPLRPSLAGAREALLTFVRVLIAQRCLLLASCLARRVLWRDSLARTLSDQRGPLILHNDFDMMSSAAIGQGVATICLQHGLPTDEFFPVRADWYVLWGALSRRAFVEAGSSTETLIVDALGRAGELVAPLAAPTGLSLLSQTHAPILGAELASWLHHLAAELLTTAPALRILLHPQEREPYRGLTAQVCTRPPHAEFQAEAQPRLVLGCCTTALFDAALAGHWVVRLVGPLDGNEAALRVLDVPLTANSAEQVVSVYERLCSDPQFRQSVALAQLSWLRESFSSGTAGFSGLLKDLGCLVKDEGRS